jgi:hypothetical protein
MEGLLPDLAEFEVGEDGSQYSEQPRTWGALTTTDQDELRRLYPDLEEQFPFINQDQDIRDASSEVRYQHRARVTTDAVRTLEETLDTNIGDMQTGTFGDPSDSDVRKSMANSIKSPIDDAYSKIAGGYDAAPPDEEKGDDFDNKDDELSFRNNQLNELFPNRRTDEEWTAYQTAYDEEFTQEEQDRMFESGQIGKHSAHQTWRAQHRLLRPYYDITDEYVPGVFGSRGAGARNREKYRKQDPIVDGILWALGETTVVHSIEAKDEAVKAFKELYGVDITPDIVEKRGTFR